MNKNIEPYFTPEVISSIAKLYGTNPENLKVLRDNVNIIYAYKQDANDFILRVTHSSVQTREVVLSEVDWLHFLSKGGVNMALPVESEKGNLLEVVESRDTYFTITKFTKAKGRKITNFNWTAPVFTETGRLTGRIHKLTKEYVPGKNIVKRLDCIDVDAKRTEINSIKRNDPILSSLNALLEKLSNIPRTKNSYGLLHNDINRGNMFIDKGKLCLFDTADCAYSWFVTDIALTLFYAIQYFYSNPSGSLQGHIRYFMTHYWEGYMSENKISEKEIEYIPDLMTLKSIFIYDHLSEMWDVNNLNHVQKNFYDQIYTFSHETFDFVNINLIKP